MDELQRIVDNLIEEHGLRSVVSAVNHRRYTIDESMLLRQDK